MDTQSLIELIQSFPIDQLRLVLMFILSYPLALLFQKLESRNSRLVFSLVPGLLIQFIMYGTQIYNLAFAHGVFFLLIQIFPRGKVARYFIGFLILQLSLIHIRRILDNALWNMDISLVYMISFSKWMSFVLNYSDGEDLDNSGNTKNPYSIKQFTIVEYLAYIHFFPSCIVGPFFEFSDFQQFINKSDKYSNVISTTKHSLLKFLTGLLVIAFWVNISNFSSADFLVSYLKTTNHTQSSKLYLAFVFYTRFLHRFRYYIGFYLSDAAFSASGLSYRQEENDLNGYSNADLISCESTINVKEFFKYWNISNHIWLKRNVFNRLISNGFSYSMSEGMTFMFSCFWHGFYPCYYLIFLTFIPTIYIQKQLNKIISKGGISIILVRLIYLVFGFTMVNFWVFVLDRMDMKSLWEALVLIKFIPLIVLFIMYLFFKVLNSFGSGTKAFNEMKTKNE